MIALSHERYLKQLSQAEFDERTKRYLDGLGRSASWTYGFRIGFTVVLVSAIALVNWEKFSAESFRHVRTLEIEKLSLEVEKLREEVRSLKSSIADSQK